MPIALVTGANRGLGRETARQLAERGYEVIVAARDEAKAREAAEAIGGRPLALDVSDPRSIERAAASVTQDPGALDVVVNNAGIGSDFGVAGADPDFDAIQRALDTNLATELEDAGVKVNSACPGFVATDTGGPMGAQKPVEDGASGIVWLATLPDDGPSGGFFRDGRPIAF